MGGATLLKGLGENTAYNYHIAGVHVHYNGKWSTIVQNPQRACKLSSLVQHGVVQTLDYIIARLDSSHKNAHVQLHDIT